MRRPINSSNWTSRMVAVVMITTRNMTRTRSNVEKYSFKPETGESSPGRYLDPEGPRAVDPAFLHDLAAWPEPWREAFEERADAVYGAPA